LRQGSGVPQFRGFRNCREVLKKSQPSKAARSKKARVVKSLNGSLFSWETRETGEKTDNYLSDRKGWECSRVRGAGFSLLTVRKIQEGLERVLKKRW